MSVRFITICTALTSTILFTFGSTDVYYTVETYPNSIINSSACDLSSPGFACDPDRLLRRYNDTFSGADYLSHFSQQILRRTNCSCLLEDAKYGFCPAYSSHGYTVSLAIMKLVRMNTNATNMERRRDVIRVFADALRQRQHRGQCDDDALIVVVTGLKTIWTSVGLAAARMLTPDSLAKVDQEAELLFTNSDYLGGLTLMLKRYGEILEGRQYLKPQNSNTDTDDQQRSWPNWEKLWSRTVRSWLTILLGLLVAVSFVVLVTLLIIRFCCNEKRTYTLGRRQQI